MTDESQVTEAGIYYGVVIPFLAKDQAYKTLEEVNRVLGYGGWVREGDFNEEE